MQSCMFVRERILITHQAWVWLWSACCGEGEATTQQQQQQHKQGMKVENDVEGRNEVERECTLTKGRGK